MLEMHLPWIELAILFPLIGSLLIINVSNPEITRKRALITCAFALVAAYGAWEDFHSLHSFQAHDHWDFFSRWLGPEMLVIDELNAPLLPITALLFLLTTVATLRTKVRRFPFSSMLFSQAILTALLTCRDPVGIIGLSALHCVPPALELRARGRSSRIFLLHMVLSTLLLMSGWAIIRAEGDTTVHSSFAILLLVNGVMIRSGCAPLHCWMTDLFENATFGTSLLFVTPMVGAYIAARLILPIAPAWILHGMSLIALATAVYAGGMALIQQDARRSFCFLFLSFSSLILVGMGIATPVGLAGALCVWLSVCMATAGFGLTIRALESRTGRLSLKKYHGLYDHMPSLAVFFLLTGLASVGFPGTVGFVGAELLVEGVISVYPYVGVFVALATALNGIAVLYTYFRLFTGRIHVASIPLTARWPERMAVLALTLLLLGGGLFPQPGITSRYHAAKALLERRIAPPLEEPQEHDSETDVEHASSPPASNVPIVSTTPALTGARHLSHSTTRVPNASVSVNGVTTNSWP
ncbi:MAG: oxidoreductase [Planctomycetales bacterium]|nr:oxidoreductase [Planctomycetales bacterium]